MSEKKQSGRKRGTNHTDEVKAAIGENQPHRTKIATPYGTFNSLAEAGRAENVTHCVIKYRAVMGDKQRNGILLWDVRFERPMPDYTTYKIEKHRPFMRRAVITPLGEFTSIANAARAEGISSSGMHHKLRFSRPGYSYKDEI